MKKRIVSNVLPLILAALFLSAPFSFAQTPKNTMTLTTYYPAPFGAYDTLFLKPRSVEPACQVGTLYVDSNGKLRYCRQEGSTQTWGSVDQVWTQNGNNIYPADTAWMVGIGTINPATDLGKGLDVHGNIYIHMAPTDAGLAFGDNDPAVNTKWHIGYWEPSILPPNGGLVFSETGVADHILTLQAGGNIGIGVSNPLARLEIKGAGNGKTTYGFGISNSDGKYSLIVRDDGHVGIGVINPTAALEVGGLTKATGGLVIETRTKDPKSALPGRIWLRTDVP